MAYDGQIFVNLLNGSDDQIIIDGTDRIARKLIDEKGSTIPSKTFTIRSNQGSDERKAIIEGFRPAMKNWRLYIRGHGNWKEKTVGGLSAGAVKAEILQWSSAGNWENGNAPDVISVTGCEAARGTDQVEEKLYTEISDKSFAYELFDLLGSAGVRSKFFARTLWVAVVGGGSASAPSGSKVTRNPVTKEAVNNQDYSKIQYLWKGNKLDCKFVDYTTSKKDDDVVYAEDDRVSS